MDQGRKQQMVEALRSQIQAAELGARPGGPLPALPFGIPEIDGALPGGGLMLDVV